jgi:ferrous iron transport protein B
MGGADGPTYRVLLAGNPNSGKTSIFNGLTGARHKVANYPGVTVEKREGSYTFDRSRFEVLDLPGTYSLSSYTPEEKIACLELLREEDFVTVVVVEATTLSRSLHLLGQIMQLHANPVLCLNMWDEFQRSGALIDLERLRTLLGIPVVATVGNVGTGLEELKAAIARTAREPLRRNGRLVLGEKLEQALSDVARPLAQASAPSRTRAWTAEKLLVGDAGLADLAGVEGPAGEAALMNAARWRHRLEAESGLDIMLYVTERYHGFVDGLLRQVLRRPPRADARAVSDRIDQVLVHPVLGIPIFLVIMYALFWLAFRVGEAPMGWIEGVFGLLGRGVSSLWTAGSTSPLRSLLVDGVIAGVGGVLVFLPNIVLLFFGLALLEDTGYMARAAFLMDRFLHKFGLHGQSFIPLMTGFGCSIPGIMATRTLRNEQDRLATILVLPLMSCGARLPIWMLLVPAFFPPKAHAPVLWGIYLVGILLALGLASLLRRSVLQGQVAPFVLELPPYRVPTLRAMAMQMFDRAALYMRKAGTIILAISIVLWAIAAYPKPRAYEIDRAIAAGEIVEQEEPLGDAVATGPATGDAAASEASPGTTPAQDALRTPMVLTPEEVEARRGAEDLRASLSGRLGRALEPLLRPMGFDWRLGSGLIGAFAAKEVFVAQMGIVYSLGAADENSESLRSALQRDYSRLAGVSLMLFLLVATPCMATVAITRREAGGWKWALAQFFGLTALGYALATAVYQMGRLILGGGA